VWSKNKKIKQHNNEFIGGGGGGGLLSPQSLEHSFLNMVAIILICNIINNMAICKNYVI